MNINMRIQWGDGGSGEQRWGHRCDLCSSSCSGVLLGLLQTSYLLLVLFRQRELSILSTAAEAATTAISTGTIT